jgi:hypothetical protein
MLPSCQSVSAILVADALHINAALSIAQKTNKPGVTANLNDCPALAGEFSRMKK